MQYIGVYIYIYGYLYCRHHSNSTLIKIVLSAYAVSYSLLSHHVQRRLWQGPSPLPYHEPVLLLGL